MNDNDIAPWESRVARLERQNRHLRAAFALFALAVLAAAGWQWRAARHADPFAPVITRDFILIDETGNQRAVFSANESSTSLELRDPLGRNRAELDITPLGPGLTLKDSHGTVRALIAVGDESPYFGLTDDNGDDLVVLPDAIDDVNNRPTAVGGR